MTSNASLASRRLITCLLSSCASLAACGGGGSAPAELAAAGPAGSVAAVAVADAGTAVAGTVGTDAGTSGSVASADPVVVATPITLTATSQTGTYGELSTSTLADENPYQSELLALADDDGVAMRYAQAAGTAAVGTPVVFNASTSARAGDIVSLQGENFGSAPTVWLDSAGSTASTPLAVVNRVGTGWLAVQIPATAVGALVLRISNGTATSAAVKLNGAVAHHLDALELSPGGAFRVVGRNLRLAGSTPTVTVGGLAATVNLAASDEHVIVATAPAGLKAMAAASVGVDNGNGTGASTLDVTVPVVAGGSGDPFALGVGWASNFASIATRVIDATKDARLAAKVACDGTKDDAPAIQAALILASRTSGGVVQLPIGTCRIASAMQLFSNVVLQGAGKDRTVLRYDFNSPPVYGSSMDLAGIRNLTFTNIGAGALGPSLSGSTRVFVQGVKMNLGANGMFWGYNNKNFVVTQSDMLQMGNASASTVGGNAGLVFTGNNISFMNNIGTMFEQAHDAWIQGNTWTRDASKQNYPNAAHTITINFSHRLAILNNTFKTINGPVDLALNSGETILTEGGGGVRTENVGSVTAATATSVTDTNNLINVNPFSTGTIPANYGVAIVAGKGAGQHRRVISYASRTMTVDRPWTVVPDTTSRYATMVWGVERTVIKGNTLTQNPRGIMIWSTAARDVDIVGNTLTENGGILVRAAQKLASKWFTPLYGIRIDNNTLKNTTRTTQSTIAVHMANLDGQAFGTAHTGVEVRNNRLTANVSNFYTNYLSAAGFEGFVNQMNVETNTFVATSIPRVLGTIMQRNTCTNCDVAFRIGTGATGTVLAGNQVVNSPVTLSNKATASSIETAVATVVQ